MTRTRTRPAPVGAMQAAADQLASLALALAFAGIKTYVPVSPDAGGSLAQYDLIIVFSSGGKDSQTALRRAFLWARREGVLDRVVVVHNDLGGVEWPGTRRLAEVQARRYGVPFIAVTKRGPHLLNDILFNRKGWPSADARYCTSDHKRGPGRVQLTALVKALAAPKREGRPARVLQVYGFRAQESTARGRKAAYAFNMGASTQGTRHVYDWLPIHAMTETEVWGDIRSSGVPYHPVYRLGMSRLSCSMCVLASKGDLLLAVRLRPALAAEYVRVEGAKGHDFQNGRTIASIVAEAAILPALEPFRPWWTRCGACGVDVLAVAGERSAYCPEHEPVTTWGVAVAAAQAAAQATQAAGCGALALT